MRTAAGLRPKKCGAGAGWDGLRGGCGLEVCGVGADKISIPAGAGRERTKKFNPRRTLVGTAELQHPLFSRYISFKVALLFYFDI